MSALSNYIEGAASIFNLFPQHEPQLRRMPRRERLTISQALAKDAEALRGDMRRALDLALVESR